MADETNEEKNEASRKKVSSMTSEQLNEAIEKTRKNMGGLWSRHARTLVAHLKDLAAAPASKPAAPKKASKKSG